MPSKRFTGLPMQVSYRNAHRDLSWVPPQSVRFGLIARYLIKVHGPTGFPQNSCSLDLPVHRPFPIPRSCLAEYFARLCMLK